MKNDDIAVGISQISETVSSRENTNIGEAIDALLVHGYESSDVVSIVSKLDKELSTEDIIKQALKKLARQV